MKIKYPIELIAGIRRILPMTVDNEEAFLLLQRILGQQLFYPPNVAGWPGGKAWIDSSTLMMRMRLPQLISDKDELNVQPKTDDDQMGGRPDTDDMQATMVKRKSYGKIGKPIQATIDWNSYSKNFGSSAKENLLQNISSVLIQAKTNINSDVLKRYIDDSSKESFIKTATIQLMSTPEYQMC